MSVLLRFAPSPTGHLHVGNARVALMNFLLGGGRADSLILRFDDTDAERSKDDYVGAIRRDLAWLGLSWGREEFQSARLASYHAAAERLKADGRLYACYETAEELEYMRRRLRARGKPPIYDRSALALTNGDKARLEAEGRRPHWRFKLDHTAIEWTDLVRGPSHFHGEHLADPVLIREDGTFLYMLPSAVDDLEMGITHVIRGEDHVTNTAVQIQLFHALGAGAPTFAHLPLLVDAEGKGLSKRLGSLSLGELRDQGIEPMAVNSLLAGLGPSDAIEPVADLATLAAGFDISHISRATPRFDPRDLDRLNQKLLHTLPGAEAAPRLAALGLAEADAAFWEAVRPNLTTLGEAAEWYRTLHGPMEPLRDEPEFLAAAAAVLPAEPWDQETWAGWTNAVKEATGRKGKALFLPLRRALTGLDHGPELKVLLPLLGRTRVLERLGA